MASEEGVVIECKSEADLNTRMAKAEESGKLVIVDFTSIWCGPCRMMAPMLVEHAKKYPQVVFLKVDIDDLTEVAQAYKIKAMPTLLFFKNGEKVDTVVGAQKDGLQAPIEKHTAASASTA